MPIVKVEMLAFEDNAKIREVNIPETEYAEAIAADNAAHGPMPSYLLDQVFHFGQNDFQPLRCCSVSVGDVILYDGERYGVCNVGFCKLSEDEYASYKLLPRRDRGLYYRRWGRRVGEED